MELVLIIDYIIVQVEDLFQYVCKESCCCGIVVWCCKLEECVMMYWDWLWEYVV